jgi:hypothetical protein
VLNLYTVRGAAQLIEAVNKMIEAIKTDFLNIFPSCISTPTHTARPTTLVFRYVFMGRLTWVTR